MADLNKNGFRILATASALAGLLSYAIILSVTPAAINEIGRFYNLNTSSIGFLYFLQYGSFLVAVVVGGWISDKQGKLPVMAVGCAMMTIGAAMFAHAPTVTFLHIALLLLGSGGAFAEGVATALVADLYQGARRTSMLLWSHVVFAIGAVSAPIFVASLLRWGVNWRIAYIGSAIICGLSALITWLAASQRSEKPTAHADDNWRVLLKDPLVLWLSLGLFLYVGAELGQGTWLAAYFAHELHSSPALSALTVAFFWAGICGGRAAAATLSARVSDIYIIRGALLAAAIFQSALLFAREGIWGVILTIGLGFCLGPVWPTVVSVAAKAHPRQSGTVFGIVIAAGAIGSAIFPALIGTFAKIIGLQTALWICTIILTLNFILFSRMRNLPE